MRRTVPFSLLDKKKIFPYLRFFSNSSKDGQNEKSSSSLYGIMEATIFANWDLFLLQQGFRSMSSMLDKQNEIDLAYSQRVEEVVECATTTEPFKSLIQTNTDVRHIVLCSLLLGTYHGLTARSGADMSHEEAMSFLWPRACTVANVACVEFPKEPPRSLWDRILVDFHFIFRLKEKDLERTMWYHDVWSKFRDPVERLVSRMRREYGSVYSSNLMSAKYRERYIGEAGGGVGEEEHSSSTSKNNINDLLLSAEIRVDSCIYRSMIEKFERSDEVREDLLGLCCCRYTSESFEEVPGTAFTRVSEGDDEEDKEGGSRCCKMVLTSPDVVMSSVSQK